MRNNKFKSKNLFVSYKLKAISLEIDIYPAPEQGSKLIESFPV